MRLGKIVAVSLLCLTLAAGAACNGDGNGAKPTATATPISSKVELTLADSGKELTLDVDDRVVITLDCDMTAGYHWHLIDYGDRSVLRKTKQQLLPPGDSDLYTYIYAFQAYGPGTSDIYMTYNRSPELDPVPADTFNLSVTVR